MKASWPLLALALLVVACGGDEFSAQPGPGGGGGAATGPYTGLLIDAQRPATMIPLKKTLDKWSVVDPAGTLIFSGDQVKNPILGGIGWEWKRENVTGISPPPPWLGTNHYTVKVDRDEYNEAATEGRFFVNDSTAATLRGMGAKLNQLVAGGRIIILVGKMGD